MLRDIEWAAQQRYRDYGLGEVADDPPASIEVLANYAASGRAWVVAPARDAQPVGYVLLEVIDGGGHIEEVSVLPEHQGRGFGRALVDQARAWAARSGLRSLTLTTYRDVPWNRPLYEHLGFRVLSEDDVGPELRALRQREAANGLDENLRLVMRQEVEPAGTEDGA